MIRPYLHAEAVVSHYEPILSLLFIKEFKQIISCTESGVIRLWDLFTGRQIHEFRAHQGHAVTSMILDTTERRLITGSRDGTCCMWNVHNGQLLKILKKTQGQKREQPTSVNDCRAFSSLSGTSEITDVMFIVVNNNCSVLTVGWDKHINVFKDDSERIKQVCLPEGQFTGDEQTSAHQDDILCIAKSRGELIATGDYGGTTVVWNMSSKKIFATLKPKENMPTDIEGNREDMTSSRRVETFDFST
jgi:WD40 repeat protein